MGCCCASAQTSVEFLSDLKMECPPQASACLKNDAGHVQIQKPLRHHLNLRHCFGRKIVEQEVWVEVKLFIEYPENIDSLFI